jgi:hypothetical protein
MARPGRGEADGINLEERGGHLMSSGTLAEKMTQGMLANVTERLDAGKHAEVEQEAGKYISSIEEGSPQVRASFAPALFKLYALRAYSRQMLDDTRAGEDVERALGALDACAELERNATTRLREAVSAFGVGEAAARRAQLDVALAAVLEGMAGAAVPARRPVSRTSGGHWSSHLFCAVTGLAVLTLPVLMVWVPGPASPFLVGSAVFGALLLTMRGWDWFSEYEFGTRGSFLKYLSVLLIAMTGVGVVAIAYWAGRGTLRLLGRLPDA